MQQLFQRQLSQNEIPKGHQAPLSTPVLRGLCSCHPFCCSLNQVSKKKCSVILTSYFKRAGQEICLSLPAIQISNITASGKLGIPGEFQGMQASAGVLQMGRQKKSLAEHHRGIQQIVCSTNNCSLKSVVDIQQILQYLSLHLLSPLRKADLMRTMSEPNTGDIRQAWLGTEAHDVIQCQASDSGQQPHWESKAGTLQWCILPASRNRPGTLWATATPMYFIAHDGLFSYWNPCKLHLCCIACCVKNLLWCSEQAEMTCLYHRRHVKVHRCH